MQIRKIQVSDSPELLRLRNLAEDLQFYRNSKEVRLADHEVWITERVSGLNSYSWVAVNHNELMGTCYFDEITNGVLEVSIRVFPAFRGTECAQTLLSRALREVRSNGLHAVVATIHRENSQSIGFFAKNGFKKKEPKKDNFVELVMQLD